MPLPTSYQDFIHLSRYSRWLESEADGKRGKRQLIDILISLKNHLKENHNYVEEESTVQELRKAVLNLEVMPSMRALMTAGPALERENVAGYNCSLQQ